MYDDERLTDATRLAQEICDCANLRAIAHYERAYKNYVINWKVSRDEPWFDERYPFPMPELAKAVEFDEYGWPSPSVTLSYVCDAKPSPEEPEETPEGNIVFGGLVPVDWGYPELAGCLNATRQTKVDVGTVAVNPADGIKYVLRRYGIGPWAPLLWFPREG